MQEIRPYSLVQKQIRSQDLETKAVDDGSGFRRYLGEELAVPEDREAPGPLEAADGVGEGVDLDYVAAELACRQNLLDPKPEEGGEGFPMHTAHFLCQQRRSVASPLQAGRLGGVVKAALQSRISIPPPGAMPPPRSGE